MCSVVQSCLSLCDPVDCSPPGSSSSWSVPCNTGVQFPAPGDLPSPEIEPLTTLALADGFCTAAPPGPENLHGEEKIRTQQSSPCSVQLGRGSCLRIASLSIRTFLPSSPSFCLAVLTRKGRLRRGRYERRSLVQYGCSLNQRSTGSQLPVLSEWAILTGEEGMLILWLDTWNSIGGGRQPNQERGF